MSFHLDCPERHGLVSIETKPAAYGAHIWICDACKLQIPERHIGVLHCERCRCDICPSCWTILLPKIVNAAGYPCFWRQTTGPPSAMLLGCHRANAGNVFQVRRCGLDDGESVLRFSSFVSRPPPPPQCGDCASKQRDLQNCAAAGAVAPYPRPLPMPVAPATSTVTPHTHPPLAPGTGSAAPPQPGLFLTVHNMNLRVRSSASLESPVVGLLLMGKQFRFTNFVGSWAKLSPSHYSDLSQSANCNPEDFRPHDPVHAGWCLMKNAQGEILLAESAYSPPLCSSGAAPVHPPPPFASGGFASSSASGRITPGSTAPRPPPPPPRVLMSADRVTFTVQSEIPINQGHFNASADSSADAAEAQWLSQFSAYLSQNDAQLNHQQRRGGQPAPPPAVQAFYRSCALANSRPSMRKQLDDVSLISNGLVTACLTAFTEVN